LLASDTAVAFEHRQAWNDIVAGVGRPERQK